MAVTGVSELHLHLEGSLSVTTAVELARDRQHSWGMLSSAALRRSFRFAGFDDFLASIREMCRVIGTPDGLERGARELSHFLASTGVLYAEVYTSPYIYVRWGVEFGSALGAVAAGFERGEEEGGARCAILVDTVRQWGPEAAGIVLDGVAAMKTPRVVGFGMGGEERVPLEDFASVYRRARDLGLRTTVHAGEFGPASDVRKAIEVLSVDRIAHGIRAVDDPALLSELAARRIALDVSVTSNYRTAAVRGPHPVRSLVDAGVPITLSTDDPSLFRTSLAGEYRRAARFGELSPEELTEAARNAIEFSFAPAALREELHHALDQRLSV